MGLCMTHHDLIQPFTGKVYDPLASIRLILKTVWRVMTRLEELEAISIGHLAAVAEPRYRSP